MRESARVQGPEGRQMLAQGVSSGEERLTRPYGHPLPRRGRGWG